MASSSPIREMARRDEQLGAQIDLYLWHKHWAFQGFRIFQLDLSNCASSRCVLLLSLSRCDLLPVIISRPYATCLYVQSYSECLQSHSSTTCFVNQVSVQELKCTCVPRYSLCTFCPVRRDEELAMHISTLVDRSPHRGTWSRGDKAIIRPYESVSRTCRSITHSSSLLLDLSCITRVVHFLRDSRLSKVAKCLVIEDAMTVSGNSLILLTIFQVSFYTMIALMSTLSRVATP